MKNITPNDSRYIPIVQLKSCCVPACISMVMYKHNIPLLPQEKLGYYLGLTVPQKNKKLYWNPRTGKRPPTGYGTRINLKQYHPNTVFPKLKIPLKMIFYPISSFTTEKDLIKYVTEAVKKDKDILACFDHGQLSGDNIQGGHVCVVDRIDIKKGSVRLIDPEKTQPKWRVVKIKTLMKAMKFHGEDKSAGFWEFVKI